jgi:hypothetical protein
VDRGESDTTHNTQKSKSKKKVCWCYVEYKRIVKQIQDKSKELAIFNVPNFEKDTLNTQPSPPIPMKKR